MQKKWSTDKIHQLMSHSDRVRNISIMAHVDHGKTTLVDSLLSSNFIVSKKQAGKLKYMDSRVDQQDRGITMKASSISVVFPLVQDYLVNIIDSPGHIEFGFQVSSALSLTDGALILVDVVEGVTSQTYACLKRAFTQRIKSVLVLNKMDRLFKELQLSAEQAYRRLQMVIQQVNAVLGSMVGNIQRVEHKNQIDISQDDTIEQLQNTLYFAPQNENIIFASAIDTWAFTLSDFAGIFADKLKAKKSALQKVLWGNFYFNKKSRRVSCEGKSPMFVQFVLSNIWKVYQSCYKKDIESLRKIISALNLPVQPHTQFEKMNEYQLVTAVMGLWLPLQKAVLRTVVLKLPSPVQAQAQKLQKICPQIANSRDPSVLLAKSAIQKCLNGEDQPVVAFISKVVNFSKQNVNQRGLSPVRPGGRMIGMARLFSGKIRRGQTLFVIAPKLKKNIDEEGQVVMQKDCKQFVVKDLYLQMGHHLQGVPDVSAGNVFGIGGLDELVFKTATISSFLECPSITPLVSHSKSILKVRVFCKRLEDHTKLAQGLKKLDKADPSVQVKISMNGEITLTTCGEIHLQRCIYDLVNNYSLVPIEFSDPIVQFREAITYNHLQAQNNKQYLQELKSLRELEKKRQESLKLKAEMFMDKQMQEHQKAKKQALDDWDYHVEKYNADDMTVDDIRYFQKPEHQQQEKKTLVKIQKKAMHKNKGKLLAQTAKFNFVNLRQKTNVVRLSTANDLIKVTVRAVAMPFEFAQFLQKKSSQLQTAIYRAKNNSEPLQSIKKQMLEQLKKRVSSQNMFDFITNKAYCLGPNQSGPNFFLIRNLPLESSFFASRPLELHSLKIQDLDLIIKNFNITEKEILHALLSGFELAVNSGPLCEEPMMGSLFVLQEIKIDFKAFMKKVSPKQEHLSEEKDSDASSSTSNIKDPYGPLLGQLISTTKQACLQSFLGANPRLVEPVYFCDLHCTMQHYGNVYSVINKRRGTVLSDELQESFNQFSIKTHIPVVESFGLYSQMLNSTHGMVNAQLSFDTFKMIEQDPFYVPFTKDQLQDEGLLNVLPNMARGLINKIREKKGLPGEKMVMCKQKQSTLSKKR